MSTLVLSYLAESTAIYMGFDPTQAERAEEELSLKQFKNSNLYQI